MAYTYIFKKGAYACLKGENSRLQLFNNQMFETRKKKQKNKVLFMFLQLFLVFILCAIWCTFLFLSFQNMLNVYFVKILYEFEKNGEVAKKVAKKFTSKKLEARYYKEDEKQ